MHFLAYTPLRQTADFFFFLTYLPATSWSSFLNVCLHPPHRLQFILNFLAYTPETDCSYFLFFLATSLRQTAVTGISYFSLLHPQDRLPFLLTFPAYTSESEDWSSFFTYLSTSLRQTAVLCLFSCLYPWNRLEFFLNFLTTPPETDYSSFLIPCLHPWDKLQFPSLPWPPRAPFFPHPPTPLC
jgi:hypothetical protein